MKVIGPALPHCAGQAVSGFIGTAHADIGFLSARGLARRSTNEVVVAVIDTGRPKGDDFFGPPFITFVCDVPAGGRYRVLIDAINGPDCGKVRLLQDASGQDHTADLYAESRSRANGMLIGEVEAQEGNNNLMFSVVGKNSASSALGFDLINIILEKVPASNGAQRP